MERYILIPRGVVRFDYVAGTVTVPNSDPIQVAVPKTVKVETAFQPIRLKGPELWAELHSKEDPTPEWFEDWLKRVPNYGCGCQKSFRDYLKENPPRYDDWYAWTVEAHNWVNVKRGVAVWPTTTG